MLVISMLVNQSELKNINIVLFVFSGYNLHPPKIYENYFLSFNFKRIDNS